MESLNSAVLLMTYGICRVKICLLLSQFTCLPNELVSAPRLFTKFLKLVYSNLRQMGHVNVGYIDDSYLKGPLFDDAVTMCMALLNSSPKWALL